MRNRQRPADVQNAVYGDDVNVLSRAGREGGLTTTRKRAREREVNAIFAARTAELRLREEAARMVEANEHLIPVDPRNPETPESYR